MKGQAVYLLWAKVGRKGHTVYLAGIFSSKDEAVAWARHNPPRDGCYYSMREHVIDHPEIHPKPVS